jgi:hypothetical protein
MTSGSHRETGIEVLAVKLMISASDGEVGEELVLFKDMLPEVVTGGDRIGCLLVWNRGRWRLGRMDGGTFEVRKFVEGDRWLIFENEVLNIN